MFGTRCGNMLGCLLVFQNDHSADRRRFCLRHAVDERTVSSATNVEGTVFCLFKIVIQKIKGKECVGITFMMTDELWVDFKWCPTHIEILDNFTKMLATRVGEVFKGVGRFKGEFVIFFYKVHECVERMFFHELACLWWHILETFFEEIAKVTDIARDRVLVTKGIDTDNAVLEAKIGQEGSYCLNKECLSNTLLDIHHMERDSNVAGARDLLCRIEKRVSTECVELVVKI